jgi:hypothetical protein
MPSSTGDASPKSNRIGVVELDGVITFGSDSVTAQTSKGFTVARTGAGIYSVTFDHPYPTLLNFQATQFKSGAASGFTWEIRTELAAGVLVIHSLNTAGAVAASVTGEKAYFAFRVRNTTV